MNMLKRLPIVLVLLLAAVQGASVTENKPPTVIVLPQENTLVHELPLSVVLQVDPKAVDTVTILTASAEKRLDVNSSKRFYCKTVMLELGDNTLHIRSYKEGVLRNEQKRHLYVTSPLYSQYKYPPTQYKRQFFHTDRNESLCRSCHDMSVNEKKGIAFIDVKESNCYACHHQLTKEKYAHAPSVNWLCTSCHNGKVGSDNAWQKGRSKFLVSKPVNSLCFGCHKKNAKLWKSYRFRHEPLDSGRCNKCHNSHSSPYKMFVRKPVNSICLGCHKDKRMRVKQRDSDCEGTIKGKECVACHSPHASNKQFFLMDEEERKKLESKQHGRER